MFIATRTMMFKNMSTLYKSIPLLNETIEAWKKRGVEANVLLPTMGGVQARVVMTVRFDDLSNFYAVQQEAALAPEIQALFARFAEVVDGSQTTDQIWKTLT